MAKALGILNFENSKNHVEGLSDFRTISAVSILGRYSVMDFMMSNFTNSGIDNINVFVKEKPRTLKDDIVFIFTPFHYRGGRPQSGWEKPQRASGRSSGRSRSNSRSALQSGTRPWDRWGK